MATNSQNDAPDDAEIDSYKHSLLDTLNEQYNNNKELRCTRVVYIGFLSSEQKDVIENIHQKYIKSQTSLNEITGALLFINNNLFYHIIEVESLESLQPLFEEMVYDSSNNVFKNMILSQNKNNKNDLNNNKQCLENIQIKICCVSEEITREFPIWSVREVSMPGGNNNNSGGNNDDKKKQNDKDLDDEDGDDEQDEDEESLQSLLFDTMKGMIEIGRQLCMKQDNDAALKLFQSSQREIINRFPTPDKIEFFMDTKLLFDLKQFMNYFFTPINIKLESEHTWPVPSMIKF